MLKNVFYIIICILYLLKFVHLEEGSCYADGNSVFCESSIENKQAKTKYLLYDVNPGEGFNLRRDVYMRIASVVKKLNEDSRYEWILILPPWGPLYHWKSKNIGFQAQIKWSKFFDISHLAQYVPVIEFEDFLKRHDSEIDVVYYLQHYAEGWKDDRWEERVDIRECIEQVPYDKIESNGYVGWFWGYEDVIAKKLDCLSIQGYSSTLKSFLIPLNVRTIMIDRAEVILHDSFGDSEYWKIRTSMVFSKDLTELGDNFRKQYLNSTNEQDKTSERSYNLIAKERTALGGPYVCVHLRRRDFIQSRSNDVPDIRHAANQVLKQMEKLNLKLVFVATDAYESEFKEFQQYIPSAVRFIPDPKVHREILDGGVAIVDQWICSHSRYFIGTYESTFSFRIQEEREILGFPVEMTFNRLCGNNQTICKQPAKWTIVH